MKKLIGIILSCLSIAFQGHAQTESATRGSANNVRQPNVIVVPYTTEGQDVRQILDNNRMMLNAISKVKEEFNNRGFNTKDFVTLLQASKRNDIVSATTGAKSDPVKDLVLESKADISVTVNVFVNPHEGGVAEVNLVLQAAEAISGESFANASYTSDKFRTTDSLSLANRALSKINDDFFTLIQNGFNTMMETGRNLNVRIELGPNSGLDPYSEMSTGNDLEMELTNWLDNYAYGGNYEINSSDMVIDISMKVPIYDQITGKPYAINKIRTPLVKFLKSLLTSEEHTPKTKFSSGQQIWLVIE